MFVAGCGRLFEGTAAMMHRALNLGFARLDDDTAVYPGHEYAEKNLRFAHEVEPDNTAVRAHHARVQERRRAGLFCVPSTIRDEKATNPFLRLDAADVRAFANSRGGNANDPVEVLAAVRRARDEF
jgi:hydroxyacylglutathione hydrolase